ncbi:hypothetical protein K1719_013319 [Acacia pycnantha]|nr:hypothetical protein K1719_013319 [Acacia pycnantha]
MGRLYLKNADKYIIPFPILSLSLFSLHHTPVREPIFGKKSRSELAHSWNKSVDQAFGPLIKSLISSRGW